MPSPFDIFGPFEHSLRSYNDSGSRNRICPQGIHTHKECSCEINNECKRPHCSNDIALDPCCKLSNGTPFGVPITSWPSNRCHEVPPPLPLKHVSAFSVAITDRLYATPTHASAAKKRSGSVGRCQDETDDGNKINRPEIIPEKRDGNRFVMKLLGETCQRSNDYFRRDGISSPIPGRRSQSLNSNRSNNQEHSNKICRSKSTNARSCNFNKLPRSSESEFSFSSPEDSPAHTPTLLSPKTGVPSKNNPLRAGATPRLAVARFSAAFAGGSSKVKKIPIRKSASDGVEQMRRIIQKKISIQAVSLLV